MNKELLEQLLGIIKGGKDFVLSQAPDVVRQMITYNRIISSIALVISIAALWYTY